MLRHLVRLVRQLLPQLFTTAHHLPQGILAVSQDKHPIRTGVIVAVFAGLLVTFLLWAIPGVWTWFVSTIGQLSRILSIRVAVPLWLFGVIILATIGLVKLIQWLVRPHNPFQYAGLLWWPHRLSLGYPTPTCPRDDCGCEVVCQVQYPPATQFIGVGSNNQLITETTFMYECPAHGRLMNVPNEDVALLQKKAKMLQSRRKSK